VAAVVSVAVVDSQRLTLFKCGRVVGSTQSRPRQHGQ
jgi:hypothetical protein